ncbi:hypothetical protein HAX54_049099 [Datura stramonium]|uniref:Uncharacterized protein n=1 Tax=Datura stramonium TaxID=4076 RepID=A0ABS8SW59_DATST|nr:hypothetical protein [Datura stramonium]
MFYNILQLAGLKSYLQPTFSNFSLFQTILLISPPYPPTGTGWRFHCHSSLLQSADPPHPSIHPALSLSYSMWSIQKRYESSKKPYLSKSVSDANSHNQSLASILNNPHAGKSDGWWWPSNSPSLPVVPEFTPLNPLPKPGSDITRTDFLPYITSFSDPFARFHDIQQHSKSSLLDDQNGENALVACLREVPALYFKEDFQLEDGVMFKLRVLGQRLRIWLCKKSCQAVFGCSGTALGEGDFLAFKLIF